MTHIENVSMLGCPLEETPLQLQPLYEKLYVWKYGMNGGDAIWNTKFCPYIREMYSVYAASLNKPVHEVFRGAVYLVSPLRFGHFEAEQFVYFQEHGLKVYIGCNAALGGGLPVTIAGGLSVVIAENILISPINYAFWGEARLVLATSVSNIDMSFGLQQYGRPEKSIANMAMAQIARHLHVRFAGHCGLSDAKTPSCEAGVQKVTSALSTAVMGGKGYIPAGLLGSDSIFSPIQMIFDDEIIGFFQRIGEGLEVNEESLAFDSILEVGCGGTHLLSEHAA